MNTIEPCASCGATEVAHTEKGPHIAETCAVCGKWRRNVRRSELGLERRSVSTRPTIKPKVRHRVLDRFGFACVACGATATDVRLQVDHLIPVELAKALGLYDAELIESEVNLAPLCEECNGGKGGLSFSERTMRHLLLAHALWLASERP